MPGNSIGNIYRLTSFGESHGEYVGGVIEGCPPGQKLNLDLVQIELNRRRPGQSAITTKRTENDKVKFISGLFNGKTLGTPIAFIVKNNDPRHDDYENLKDIFRPSHADYTYYKKYGIRDYRGGGRASARESVSRVVAGAIAKQFLRKINVEIIGFVSQVGDIKLEKSYNELDLSSVDSNIIRCPDKEIAEKMINKIEEIKNEGDSIGGIVSCVIKNVPAGLGEPVFDKFHAELGKAILSINAVKGFDYGSGFEHSSSKGSELNDLFYQRNGRVRTITNFSGGIQGGITNGEDIYFRAVFKPVPTIMKSQNSINTEMQSVDYVPSGRNDICVLPRAVPIVEAMASIITFDFFLINNVYNRADVHSSS